jgi:hypothetical protein
MIEGYHAVASLLFPRVGGPLTTWDNAPARKISEWAWVDYFFNLDRFNNLKVGPADLGNGDQLRC